MSSSLHQLQTKVWVFSSKESHIVYLISDLMTQTEKQTSYTRSKLGFTLILWGVVCFKFPMPLQELNPLDKTLFSYFDRCIVSDSWANDTIFASSLYYSHRIISSRSLNHGLMLGLCPWKAGSLRRQHKHGEHIVSCAGIRGIFFRIMWQFWSSVKPQRLLHNNYHFKTRAISKPRRYAKVLLQIRKRTIRDQ